MFILLPPSFSYSCCSLCTLLNSQGVYETRVCLLYLSQWSVTNMTNTPTTSNTEMKQQLFSLKFPKYVKLQHTQYFTIPISFNWWKTIPLFPVPLFQWGDCRLWAMCCISRTFKLCEGKFFLISFMHCSRFYQFVKRKPYFTKMATRYLSNVTLKIEIGDFWTQH